MKVAPYSLAALRAWRRRREQGQAALTLRDLPPEAPMQPHIALGCWNGQAFVSWEKWLATAPIRREEKDSRAA